ncbi:MAG: hypothetical protein E3J91_03215 [Hadesarchaea archaeon]|nr:MAG: hypothetical protein E3J91_03215 [Hadesarchaea archaeon]
MVEKKELLGNARKIVEKRASKLNQTRKGLKRRVWDLQQSQLMLMRRKKLLAKLKDELENIKQENLEQMLKALEAH